MSPKEFEMIEPQGEDNNDSNNNSNNNSNANFNNNSNNNQSTKTTNPNTSPSNQPADNQILDSDFMLLIIILLIFFQKPDIFSEKFQLLNKHLSKIQNYLDATDATLQALDQASQIPNQKLS